MPFNNFLKLYYLVALLASACHGTMGYPGGEFLLSASCAVLHSSQSRDLIDLQALMIALLCHRMEFSPLAIRQLDCTPHSCVTVASWLKYNQVLGHSKGSVCSLPSHLQSPRRKLGVGRCQRACLTLRSMQDCSLHAQQSLIPIEVQKRP